MFNFRRKSSPTYPTAEDIDWIEHTFFWLFEIFGAPDSSKLIYPFHNNSSNSENDSMKVVELNNLKSYLDLSDIQVKISWFENLSFLQRNSDFLQGEFTEKLVFSSYEYNESDTIATVEINLAQSISENEAVVTYLIALELVRVKLLPFLSAEDELFEEVLTLTTIYFGFGILLHNHLKNMPTQSKFGVIPIEIVDYSIAWLLFLTQSDLSIPQNVSILNKTHIVNYFNNIKKKKDPEIELLGVRACHENFLFYKKIDELTLSKNFIKAIEISEDFKLRHPHNHFIDILMANCYFDLKMYQKALDHYEIHLKESQDNFEIVSQAGLCHLFLRDTTNGERLIDRAYHNDKSNAICLRNMGILSIVKHNDHDALQFLKTSKVKKRNLAMLDFYLAYVSKKLDNMTEYDIFKQKFQLKKEINNSIFDL
jgi:tetratricopeptide (TPR) repeat protein